MELRSNCCNLAHQCVQSSLVLKSCRKICIKEYRNVMKSKYSELQYILQSNVSTSPVNIFFFIHSSPSGRFRRGKIANFLSQADHVCIRLCTADIVMSS